MKRLFIGTLISLLFVVLTGCASTINTYEGKRLPLSESGVLTCESNLTINAIDGNKNYHIASAGGLWFRDCAVSLAPGKHTITFRYYSGGTVSFSTGYVTHEVNIEKGNIYRIKYTFEGKRWKPWIEKLTGEELKVQRKRVKEKFAGK